MAETERAGKGRPHSVILTARELLEITGVEDVTTFDDRSIIMQTALGTLSVDGEGLRIVSFSSPQEFGKGAGTRTGQAGERNMSLCYDDSGGGAPSLQSGCIKIEGLVCGIIYTDDEKPTERGGLFGFMRKH